MAYERDSDAYTRGVGAIAASDHAPSRRRQRVLRARVTAARDRKLAGITYGPRGGLALGKISLTNIGGGGVTGVSYVPPPPPTTGPPRRFAGELAPVIGAFVVPASPSFVTDPGRRPIRTVAGSIVAATTSTAGPSSDAMPLPPSDGGGSGGGGGGGSVGVAPTPGTAPTFTPPDLGPDVTLGPEGSPSAPSIPRWAWIAGAVGLAYLIFTRGED